MEPKTSSKKSLTVADIPRECFQNNHEMILVKETVKLPYGGAKPIIATEVYRVCKHCDYYTTH